jgi:hypothetical protein
MTHDFKIRPIEGFTLSAATAKSRRPNPLRWLVPLAVLLTVIVAIVWLTVIVSFASAQPSVSATPDWKLQEDKLTYIEANTHEYTITADDLKG